MDRDCCEVICAPTTLQDYGGNHINEYFKRKIRDLRKPLAAAVGLTLESVKPFAKTK